MYLVGEVLSNSTEQAAYDRKSKKDRWWEREVARKTMSSFLDLLRLRYQ